MALFPLQQTMVPNPLTPKLTMLLSVIIPYYNIEDNLLIRCVNSVLNAGMNEEDYEIILVDDGSERPPVQTEEYFIDNRQIRWSPMLHRGLGAARNHGTKQARGEYILYLDADDYLYAGTFLPVWEETVRSRCDIMRFGYRFCTSIEEEHPKQPATPTFSQPVDGNTYMQTHHLPGMACVYLFRKTLRTDVGLNFSEKGFIEDEAFTTILHYRAQSVVESNTFVYAYYKRAGSITQNRSFDRQSQLSYGLFRAINDVYDFRRVLYADQLPTQGIDRKLNALTVDLIRRILTNDYWELEWIKYERLLQPLHLLPLKGCDYTFKYRMFSRLSNHSWGRSLLRTLLTLGIH